jgi:hypothetical protein
MAVPDLAASTVLAKSASLLNDTARTVYTYAALLPYLQIAMQELQEEFQLRNISSSQFTSAVITVPAGTAQIIYNGVGVPTLPIDMIEPQQLWERPSGIDPYIPMIKRDYIPHQLEGILVTTFGFYVWESQTIKFLPASGNIDVKIDYIKELFQPLVDENSAIGIINAASFLEYRTAALAAEFIERNQSNANSMNTYAVLALDRAAGIGINGKQAISTRRRPFRSSFKKRGFMT